jgi:hypothetical protein
MSFKKGRQIKEKAIFPGYRGFIVPTENGYKLIGSFTRDKKYDEFLMGKLQKTYNKDEKHFADMKYDNLQDRVCILTG